MSSKEQLAAIRRRVKKDPKVKRFQEAFDTNPAFSLPFSTLHEELSSMHTTRMTRSLRRGKNSINFTRNIVDAMLQDQAVRSRCTEILGECVKINNGMKTTLQHLRDYLLVEHSAILRTLPTQAERKSFIEYVLRSFYEYLQNIDTLQEHCRIVIEDIDKAGYSHKNTIEAIKILVKPEQVTL